MYLGSGENRHFDKWRWWRDRGFVFLFFNSNFSFFLIFFFIFLYFLYAYFADTMSFLSVFDKCCFKFEIFFRYVRFSSVEGTLDRSNANVAKKKKKKWVAMRLVREERFVECIFNWNRYINPFKLTHFNHVNE